MRTAFAILLTVFFAFAPTAAMAAPVCACFFGDSDCATEAVAADAQAATCEATCKSRYKDQFQTFKFEDSAIGNVPLITECEKAHAQIPAKPAQASVVPTLQVDIPGIEFSPIKSIGNELNINFLSEYISGLYKYLISIATIIAIVFVMIGGFQWTLSAGIPSQLSKAKKRITNALIGLTLLVSVILILETVFPELARTDPIMLRFVEEIPMVAKHDPGDVADETSLADVPQTSAGKFFNGGALCTSPAQCVQWCQNNKDQSSWPTANKKTVDPTLTKLITDSPGLNNPSRSRATGEMAAALQIAGAIAVKNHPDYEIRVSSAFRPLKIQIKLACDLANSGNPESVDSIGKVVAFPGGSNHGSGNAVDLALYKNNSAITTLSATQQNKAAYKEGAAILADIMAEAGFVRYAKEMWHFELEGKAATSCRCKGAGQCPFPPRC